MRAGQKIRDYVLEEQIGAGGVGEVWLAHHERLSKRVAIKFILPHLCRDQSIYERFVQEAVAMANLEHPHIVGVHDFFNVGENACLVMSYVDGGSLQDKLSQHKLLPLREALFISRAILEALDFAHRRTVIHRDVKPSNILLSREARPYLTDFGIALVLGKTRVTRFGTNVGTPEYMSPEQIRGEDLDHKTDVYSFGCVLYEMLAGAPPFGSLDEVTEFTLMRRHIEDAPRPPRTLNSEVDAQTEAVVMRALAKDRNERFHGCAEMAKALPSLPEGDAAAANTRPFQSPGKASRRLKIAVAVSVAATVISLIGWNATYQEKERLQSSHWEKLSLEDKNRELSAGVEKLKPLENKNRELSETIERLQKELAQARTSADQAVKDARAGLAKPDGPRQDAKPGIRERFALLEKNAQAESADGLNSLAWFLATVNDSRFRDGQRAINLARQAVRKSPEDRLWISTDTLAAALAERGFFTEAIQTQEQAIAHLKKVDPDMREPDRHVELDQHLKSLRRHQPWRDEAITIFNVRLFNTNSRLDPLGPYTDSFVQDAIRFIAFETDLDKKSEGKGLLGIRYIRPNGTWLRNNSSPIGLTTEIEIAPGRRSLKWGWGNAERSIFTNGKYRLEFYWGVEKLATKSFDVR